MRIEVINRSISSFDIRRGLPDSSKRSETLRDVISLASAIFALIHHLVQKQRCMTSAHYASKCSKKINPVVGPDKGALDGDLDIVPRIMMFAENV